MAPSKKTKSGPSWTLEDGTEVTIVADDAQTITMSNGVKLLRPPNSSPEAAVEFNLEFIGPSALNHVKGDVMA